MNRGKLKWLFFDMGSTLIDESLAIEHRIREVIEGADITYEEFLEKKVFNRAGCKPQEAAMIGDRLDNDIVPANELGMYSIWVKQGNWIYATPREKLEYPDWAIGNLNELKELVKEESV